MTNTHLKFARTAAARTVHPLFTGPIPGRLPKAPKVNKRTGGFDTSRTNQCGSCFTARAATGACACL